jgi:hypothetical protein
MDERWVKDGNGWRLGDRYAEACSCREVGPEWSPHQKEKVPNTDPPMWLHFYVDEKEKTITILRGHIEGGSDSAYPQTWQTPPPADTF